MADEEGRQREQRMNDEMDRLSQQRDQRETNNRPVRPQQGPRPERPERDVTPGWARTQQDAQGLSADTAKKPTEAQLLHAMQNTWDFSGMDLSGDFSAANYPKLQHLQKDGRVSASEIIDVENFKNMAHNVPKPDMQGHTSQTYNQVYKAWNTDRDTALATRAREVGGIKFSHTNLSGANLSGMDFNLNREATGPSSGFAMSFRGAKLTGAQLQSTQFGAVDFTGADLRGADASKARFEGSNLSEVQINEKTTLANTDLDRVVGAPKEFTQQVKGHTRGAKVNEKAQAKLDKKNDKGNMRFG